MIAKLIEAIESRLMFRRRAIRRRARQRGRAPLRCRQCGRSGAAKRRQNTAYADDTRNFDVLCAECQAEADEYWQGMWDDYYGGRM